MARKKKEETPAPGSPAWMATFSDLMNLLLCFFVLLFSMSSVDAQKFEEAMASIQSTFSILPSGGSALDEGVLISSGVSQLSEMSQYYTSMGLNSEGELNAGDKGEEQKDFLEQLEQEKMQESEMMAEEIYEKLEEYHIETEVEMVTTSSYVMLNLNGGILFDSGSDELKSDALEIMSKIGDIVLDYDGYIVEIVGHTDNVPINSAKFPDNTVLSMYRAYSVYKYFIDVVGVSPETLKSSGKGEYVPIADNSTAEGRAQNRRVEIKIYNTFTTD